LGKCWTLADMSAIMSEDRASKRQHLRQQTLSFLKKSCDSKATAEFLGKLLLVL